MNRFAWSTIVVALAAIVQSAAATDPYPLDALTEITARWADAAADVQTIRAEVRRYVYDDVLRTVEASEGILVFERPTRCRVELRPISAVHSQPVSANGFEYTHQRARPMTLIWTDEGLYWIAERTESDWVSASVADGVVPEDEPEPSGERPLYEENPLWKLLVKLLGPRRDPPRAKPGPLVAQSDTPALQQTIPALQQTILLPFDWETSFWKPSLSLQDVVPILLSTPAEITDQGLTLEEKRVPPKGLSAVPNDALKSVLNAERINILIDQTTGLPYATQAVGRVKTVVNIMENVQLNPTVRDDEFRPTDEQMKLAQ